MFRTQTVPPQRNYLWAIIVILCLSLAALIVTIWIMSELLHEQEIVAHLIQNVPSSAQADAKELAGEIRWQLRLSALVILNLIATGFAIVLLWRGYSSSQQSLKDIKHLAGDILNSMEQVVITTDTTGRITSVNRKGFEILHITEAHIGSPLSDACPDLELDVFRLEAMQESSQRMMREFQLCNGGSAIILRGFCQAMHDRNQNETGSILQLRDVTERRLVENQIQRMERFMGLGSLAAGLHHEIKNPLAALSLHVQLLEELLEQTQSNSEIEGILKVLTSEIARVIDVLESFRDYTSLELLNCTIVDPAELVNRQVRLITPQATNSGVKILLELGPSLPAIDADHTKLEQAILNLLLNGLEAMPSGGQLHISVHNVEERLVITIRDTGEGIPENLRGRIFDPYFSTKKRGTGMGLAVCEKVIQQHQGQISMQDGNPGTVFEILLPLKSK